MFDFPEETSLRDQKSSFTSQAKKVLFKKVQTKCLDLNISFFNFKIGQDRLVYPIEVFVASVTADFCLMQCLVFNSHLINVS